jgi:trigger factor
MSFVVRTDELGAFAMTETAEAPVTEPTSTSPAIENKLSQAVEISDVGPCKKHIKVTVERNAIDKLLDKKYSELVVGSERNLAADIPGFRRGKAPRNLVIRTFKKEVANQVKAEILMTSLEQLATEQQIAPLAPPDLNPNEIVIPDSGPLVYEFDVEVRPEFDLPTYKGLKIKRPVKEFTDVDIDKELNRLLEPRGTAIEKPSVDGKPPVVSEGDSLDVELTTKLGDQQLGHLDKINVRVDTRLVFQDSVIEKFASGIAGAQVGENRTLEMKLSESVANPALRGQTAQATFKVLAINTIKLPEITDKLLDEYSAGSLEQLRELILGALKRRLEYTQRQSARTQVLEQIEAASRWDLPQDLLQRQATRTLRRRVLEMRNAGMSDQEILARRQLLEQDSIRSTAAALKEHFVLQKVAELEKIEIEDDDIDKEIDTLAEREGESPRKLRARLEKEDMIDTLATEMLERRALDLVLAAAEYEDVPLDATSSAEQSVGGVAEKAAPAPAPDAPAPAAQ